MQALIVKYISTTGNKGSLIKATCAAGSVTISYPHELSGQACYRKAAEELCVKLEWNTPAHGQLLGGQLANGDYVFVFDNQSSRD